MICMPSPVLLLGDKAMRRCDVLRIFLRTGETADKLGGRIDELERYFGESPDYEDARQIAEALKVTILEVLKGVDYMERRFRGEAQEKAYAHVYIRVDNEVPVAGPGNLGDPSGGKT